MPYLCYGSHREDLTETVRRLVSAPPIHVAQVTTRQSVDGHLATFYVDESWKVFVTCSEGHENVFEGTGPV